MDPLNTLNTYEIEIFPERLLNAGTAERLLNELARLKSVKGILVQGPRLPTITPSSRLPAEIRAITSHEDRKITIKGEEVQLRVKVGRVIVQLNEADVAEALREIREICEKALSCKFSVRTGRFTKPKPTISNFIRMHVSGGM